MTDKPVKISSFEIEAVKRVNAVSLEPSEDGLTVIGGRNNQGKTSVIDAIAWALGGDRMKPDAAKNTDSVRDPYMKVTLSNGIVVERKGKNSSLKVTDPTGEKGGQSLLNSFIEGFALDLPKFMEGSNREKADALLEIIGVKDQLEVLDREIEQLYNQRRTIGQMEDQKRGAAEDMPSYPEAPDEPVSASKLIQEQQAILAKNGENQRKREQVDELQSNLEAYRGNEGVCLQNISYYEQQIADERKKLEEIRKNISGTEKDLITARKTAEELQDESTAEIERKLQDIEKTNEMVRTNAAKKAAEGEADRLKADYDGLTEQIENKRKARLDLLNDAKLPLTGLSVENGELTYSGHTWNDMSGSEQLKVATAIVRAIKPDCGFVLVDKLEQMDLDTLKEFGSWAESEHLQIIGTRVSSGDECSIVIQDGFAIDRDGKLPTVSEDKPIETRSMPETKKEWVI